MEKFINPLLGNDPFDVAARTVSLRESDDGLRKVVLLPHEYWIDASPTGGFDDTVEMPRVLKISKTESSSLDDLEQRQEYLKTIAYTEELNQLFGYVRVARETLTRNEMFDFGLAYTQDKVQPLPELLTKLWEEGDENTVREVLEECVAGHRTLSLYGLFDASLSLENCGRSKPLNDLHGMADPAAMRRYRMIGVSGLTDDINVARASVEAETWRHENADLPPPIKQIFDEICTRELTPEKVLGNWASEPRGAYSPEQWRRMVEQSLPPDLPRIVDAKLSYSVEAEAAARQCKSIGRPCLHSWVFRLPEGYNAPVGEQATPGRVLKIEHIPTHREMVLKLMGTLGVHGELDQSPNAPRKSLESTLPRLLSASPTFDQMFGFPRPVPSSLARDHREIVYTQAEATPFANMVPSLQNGGLAEKVIDSYIDNMLSLCDYGAFDSTFSMSNIYLMRDGQPIFGNCTKLGDELEKMIEHIDGREWRNLDHLSGVSSFPKELITYFNQQCTQRLTADVVRGRWNSKRDLMSDAATDVHEWADQSVRADLAWVLVGLQQCDSVMASRMKDMSAEGRPLGGFSANWLMHVASQSVQIGKPSAQFDVYLLPHAYNERLVDSMVPTITRRVLKVPHNKDKTRSAVQRMDIPPEQHAAKIEKLMSDSRNSSSRMMRHASLSPEIDRLFGHPRFHLTAWEGMPFSYTQDLCTPVADILNFFEANGGSQHNPELWKMICIMVDSYVWAQFRLLSIGEFDADTKFADNYGWSEQHMKQEIDKEKLFRAIDFNEYENDLDKILDYIRNERWLDIRKNREYTQLSPEVEAYLNHALKTRLTVDTVRKIWQTQHTDRDLKKAPYGEMQDKTVHFGIAWELADRSHLQQLVSTAKA